MEKEEILKEIQRLNENCKECQEKFRKEFGSFSPSVCKYCKDGAKLHELGVLSSKGESKWGDIDWSSSKFNDYYMG